MGRLDPPVGRLFLGVPGWGATVVARWCIPARVGDRYWAKAITIVVCRLATCMRAQLGGRKLAQLISIVR